MLQYKQNSVSYLIIKKKRLTIVNFILIFLCHIYCNTQSIRRNITYSILDRMDWAKKNILRYYLFKAIVWTFHLWQDASLERRGGMPRNIFCVHKWSRQMSKRHQSPETIKKLSLYRAVFSTFLEKRLGV